TAAALGRLRPLLDGKPISAAQRFESLAELGQAACRYRRSVYERASFSGKVVQPLQQIMTLLDDALAAIDHSIAGNKRTDSLYHAYNLLDLQHESAEINTLYPMLEGQVAALSAGAIPPREAVTVLEALFDSEVYRPDQRSFMLYPDRKLPGFLEKNRVPAEQVEAIPLLQRMLAAGDKRLIARDADGCYCFSSEFRNVGDLNAALDLLRTAYDDEPDAAREALQALYEQVFRHQSFTGRSGTMFGYEGLGSVYWHMVSKLLLAVQENFFATSGQSAETSTRRQLGDLYYRVREGLGFNKTPAEYGAFPTDPYSHTPKHNGARQPGMTGQVKEEVLTRFGELGIRVSDGAMHFQPGLLRSREFVSESRPFCFLDVDGNWQDLTVPPRGLAFTWCQVPVVYRLDDNAEPSLTITWHDGAIQTLPQLALPAEESSELFTRSGRIRQLTITFRTNMLFAE
ncbi:MAG: hypothetical protein OEM51_13665, partial [Gammaproteobacteria bacterium]|nr:hypothetical protein [Gammaproteobacteria bacterium]